jgi:hypothetical protein
MKRAVMPRHANNEPPTNGGHGFWLSSEHHSTRRQMDRALRGMVAQESFVVIGDEPPA